MSHTTPGSDYPGNMFAKRAMHDAVPPGFLRCKAKGTGCPRSDRPMQRDHVQWRVVGAEIYKLSVFQAIRGLAGTYDGDYDNAEIEPRKSVLRHGGYWHKVH